MPTPPDAKLTTVHTNPFDRDPLHRIGLELQRLLADTLTAPLPGDMLVLLHRLERVELEWRADVTGKRRDEPEPPRPSA
jgi:hypothetical protein